PFGVGGPVDGWHFQFLSRRAVPKLTQLLRSAHASSPEPATEHLGSISSPQRPEADQPSRSQPTKARGTEPELRLFFMGAPSSVTAAALHFAHEVAIWTDSDGTHSPRPSKGH